MPKNIFKIKVIKNGPYRVSGNVPIAKQIIIADKEGIPVKWKEGDKYSPQKECDLCRCGKSRSKPYCDQMHVATGFDGTETAAKKKYLEQTEKIAGPGLDLTDTLSLCASARFCDRGEGVWNLTRSSDDLNSKKMAIEEACDCPSGRLVVWDKKTGEAIEPGFVSSVGLVEDSPSGVSGPLWIRGGIPIESAEGEIYEIRNRVTLCRCGKSENKPFCDGTHVSVGFSDKI